MIHKAPAISETIKTEVVCPNDTNPMGILQGGKLVQWMDIAAAVCAQTHAEKICVTAVINRVDFKQPAYTGDMISIHAKITRAFTSSMEIFAQASARNVLTGNNYLFSEAYSIVVAIGYELRSGPVPPVNPVTQLDRDRTNALVTRKDGVYAMRGQV